MHKDPDISWSEYQQMCDTFLDILREDMQAYLVREEYDYVDQFLAVAVVEDTDHAILVEILRMTLPYSDLLSERAGFYDRVRSEVRRTRSERETVQLLRGL